MLHPRNCTGEFLSLSHLIGVLPPDYMITIYVDENEVWKGISWVFIYDKVYAKYRGYGVKRFDTDFYNENFFIWLYVRRNCSETDRSNQSILRKRIL